jgi:hypothetical protein
MNAVRTSLPYVGVVHRFIVADVQAAFSRQGLLQCTGQQAPPKCLYLDYYYSQAMQLSGLPLWRMLE